MAFIHDQTCECAKSKLGVFSIPLTQTSIEYENYVEYHPLSSIADLGPTEFKLSSCLKFPNTQLLVKAKITRGNGVKITDADHVERVNLFLHSLFQQVEISLSEVKLIQSAGMYAYRAYIESLLSYIAVTACAYSL